MAPAVMRWRPATRQPLRRPPVGHSGCAFRRRSVSRPKNGVVTVAFTDGWALVHSPPGKRFRRPRPGMLPRKPRDGFTLIPSREITPPTQRVVVPITALAAAIADVPADSAEWKSRKAAFPGLAAPESANCRESANCIETADSFSKTKSNGNDTRPRLNGGPNDHPVKPFTFEESRVQLRVRLRLRGVAQTDTTQLRRAQVGDLSADLSTKS